MSGRDLIIDHGVNALGVRHQTVIGDERVITKTEQSDAVCNRIMDSVHEIARDGQNKKAFARGTARIPIVLWQKWKDEWNGKNAGQRIGYEPRRYVTWREFIRIKISSREYSRLRMGT